MNIVQKIVYESFARILENIVLPKCHLKFHDSVLASFSSLLLSLLLFLRIKGPLSFLRPAFSTEEEQCLSTSSLFFSSSSTQPLLSEHLCQCFSPTLQSSSIRSSLNTYLHMLTHYWKLQGTNCILLTTLLIALGYVFGRGYAPRSCVNCVIWPLGELCWLDFLVIQSGVCLGEQKVVWGTAECRPEMVQGNVWNSCRSEQ